MWREASTSIGGTSSVVMEPLERRVLMAAPPIATAAAGAGPADYLAAVQDQFHRTYDVYTDADAAGNHFAARGRFPAEASDLTVPPMDESWSIAPHSGTSAIKAQFNSARDNYGGWYFMNGVLTADDSAPRQNWGDHPNAGVSLQGATRLTFWAKGARGGERVEFFAFGIGNTERPYMPYADRSGKVTTGFVTLSRDWTQYTIDVHDQDLSYVLGGFGWVTNAAANNGRNIIFYLDDITYDKPRLQAPRFLVSYQTTAQRDFDQVHRNAAFTYDNAVAAIAFLAAGQSQRAKLIVDALVYAQTHDRYYTDGRIRNAYQAGDVVLPAGWTPHGKVGTVRMPGWYDSTERRWLEDEYQVSTHTGNVAWAMMALLAYYERMGGKKYLDAAKRMGDWVEANVRDNRGAGGYTGGFQGWEPNPADPAGPTKLMYKSTEHNIDLASAFSRLYAITGNKRWRKRAEAAERFVRSMWDPREGKLWTGTTDDGVSPNKQTIPLDVQPWAYLALKQPFGKGLIYAERFMKVGKGYDFNTDRDGIWYEGTSQMALAYASARQWPKWRELVSTVAKASAPSGGVYATDRASVTTGFDVVSKQGATPWLYYRRLHVGATAWLVLAQYKANPFASFSRKAL